MPSLMVPATIEPMLIAANAAARGPAIFATDPSIPLLRPAPASSPPFFPAGTSESLNPLSTSRPNDEKSGAISAHAV